MSRRALDEVKDMTQEAGAEEWVRDSEPDEFDDMDDLPPKRRVDPGEMEDYDEWREERRHRGRKRRRPEERDRRRQRDEDEL